MKTLRLLSLSQLHRGPAMTVQVKDIEYKELPDATDQPYDRSLVPAHAKLETPVPAFAPKCS